MLRHLKAVEERRDALTNISPDLKIAPWGEASSVCGSPDFAPEASRRNAMHRRDFFITGDGGRLMRLNGPGEACGGP